jgi:hypothetical protein
MIAYGVATDEPALPRVVGSPANRTSPTAHVWQVLQIGQRTRDTFPNSFWKVLRSVSIPVEADRSQLGHLTIIVPVVCNPITLWFRHHLRRSLPGSGEAIGGPVTRSLAHRRRRILRTCRCSRCVGDSLIPYAFLTRQEHDAQRTCRRPRITPGPPG